ncbi:MAG: hypothetical protein ACMUIU_10735 [bacterium]
MPVQVNIFAGILIFVSFILLWRGFFDFNKDWWSWFFASIICILALLRRSLIPPPVFSVYDAFFIFVALSLIYRPSKIKEYLMFSSCLLAPLSLAGIYGFIPSSFMSLILIFLGILLGLILPGTKSFFSEKDFRAFDFILCFLLVILLGIFSFLKLSFFKGSPKNKRVLFDIGHGTTESPFIDYTRDIEGSAEFGHAKLVELVKNYSFDCGFIEDINPDELSNSSILVLIMPSRPYGIEEIKAIKGFVSAGGGLLVIGDHTDISNTLSALNPVIGQFGIRLRFDTIWIQTNSRTNLCYRPHPAIFDLERVNFSVGASIDIDFPARPVIISKYGTFSDLGDPANNAHAYLGNSKPDPGEKRNDLCLIADSLYGRGRVFVMGDSSYFQNASIYQNWAFAFRVFDWLNHCNDGNTKKRTLVVTIIILMAIILFLMVYRRLWPSILLPFLITVLVFSVWLSGLYNSIRFPKPEKIFDTVFVDMAHHNEYTLYWVDREKEDTCIDGLIGQIIRTGFFPVIDEHDPVTIEKLMDHKAIFIICPNKPFTDDEIEAISCFVENGGGLLLVEGPRKWAIPSALWERFGLIRDRYPLSVNRPVLSPFGLPIRLPYGNFRAQFIAHPMTEGISALNMVNPCRIQGGFPVAFIDGIPVINFKEFGEGRIIAIGDDRFFANYMTEFQEKIIDPDKLRIAWNIVHYLTNTNF